jgi:hypothetical protein
MKRQGPYAAIPKSDPKTGLPLPGLPPRVKHPSAIPQGSGIIDRLKRATPEERKHLIEGAKSYEFASPRTKRRILQFS